MTAESCLKKERDLMFDNNSDPNFSEMMEQSPAQQPGPQRKPIDITTDLSAQTSNLERRLRMLEERYGLMQKREQMIEENMISTNKKVSIEIKAINSEIIDLRSDIAQIKDKIELIIEELRQSARKEDIKVVEHYLDMWDPTNFATQKDVENIIRRELAKAIPSQNLRPKGGTQ